MAERPGVYQVWHRNGESFTKVAEVKGGNLLAAVVLTMNRKDFPWQDNPEVKAFGEPTRSTDLRDRIVDPDGVVYSIERDPLGVRFKEIRVSAELLAHGHLSLAGLRDEIRSDTAAGKCGDAHQYGDASGMLPAQANRSKDRDIDR
jgi:hypothetical protein